MANRDVLAIGTSAGGVEALLFLAKGFRRDFPVAVLVTIHLPRHPASSLDDVLSRAVAGRPEAATKQSRSLRKPHWILRFRLRAARFGATQAAP